MTSTGARGVLALLAAAAAIATAAAPASRPAATSRPATTRATSRAVIEPAAAPLLAKLAAAYAAERPLHVTGRLVGTFDVAGRQQTYRLSVDGVTDGRGRFRHDAGGAGLVVSDGRDAYLYDARRDSFAEVAAATGRQPADDVSGAVLDVLLDENPALLLALTDDPAGLLARAATRIAVADATGRPATRTALTRAGGLVLTRPTKTVTLWLTAAGEVASATIDYRPLMQTRGATAVKAAVVELTYDPPTHDPPPEAVFRWRPPASATEFDAGDDRLRPTTRPARPSTAPTPAGP